MTLTDEGIAVVDGDAWLSQQIRDERRLDVAQARLIVELMFSFIPVGGVVCDVGACLGDHTIGYADRVGPAGIVHAFEPNPPAFECLCHNLRDRPWVRCYQVALADQINRCVIVPEPNNLDNLGMATILRTDPDGPIPMVTLDAIAQEWSRLDFLKIDVEGLEPILLDGAAKTLERFTPPILIEVNIGALANHAATSSDVYQRLHRLGYVFMPIHTPGIDTIERMQDPEVDVVCLQRSDPRVNGFLDLA